VNLDKWSDRLEIYSMHYAVNLGVVVAFCLAVIVLVAFFCRPVYHGAVFSIRITRVPRWLQPLLVVSLLVAVVVAIDRTQTILIVYLQTNCSVPTWRVEK
jgi:hypothetical protein